ncbi:class I SAM-dependent methyltransferase [Burkholderia sp. SRS-46]|nr:class I SAM-dependent methyltransferase [Burkholderia sp. SRS-46]
MTSHDDTLYTDARLVAIYDLLNAGDHDFAFYASCIGATPQRILDLGCGTGTFARRLAAAGHQVVAIDPAQAMLDHARRQPGADAVQWLVGDITHAAALPPFDVVVMTGHAFQCLLTDADIDATLHDVRHALTERGRFLFETRNPHIAPWRAWTPEHTARTVRSPASGTVDVHHAACRADGQIVTFDTHYRFARDGALLTHASRLRFIAQPALRERLRAARFADVDWFGDWRGAPFDAASSAEIIAICRA